VAMILLNRPKSLNALCGELCREMILALKDLDQDDAVRAIIITGNGKHFAAGADIKEMNNLDFAQANRSNLFADWDQIQEIRKPIIAAVNGYALGGGCELALMCDIIIASKEAKFGQPEIQLGTIPGMGGSQRLVRAIGKSKAMEWVLTGRHIDAEEAERAGLVSKVVEAGSLQEEAILLAEKIANYSQPTVAAAKECVLRAMETSLNEGLLFERRVFHSTFANHDRKEGMDAFVNKRSPNWLHK